MSKAPVAATQSRELVQRVCSVCAFLAAVSLAAPGKADPSPIRETLRGTPRPPGQEVFVRLELHGSVLTDASDRSDVVPAFGYAFKGGYRWKHVGIFAEFEQDFWVATEFDVRVVQGVYNVGAGIDFTYFEGRAHTSIAFGPSILAFDTELDPRGSLGWFLDLRPIGVQWDVHRYVRLGLDPLSFAVVAPSLDGIPLVQIEYRTTFYLETPF